MTVSEVINKVDILRRNNQFTIGDKMRWLNECEAKIQLDCLLLPNVEIIYEYEKDADEELIAKLPFDELYIYYICSHIDEALGDEKAYNNSITRYNSAHHNYQKWLIENVDPKRNKVELTRPEPVIYRGDKTTLTIYNLPADASEIVAATMELNQKSSIASTTNVSIKGNTMTAVLTELQTFNFKEGGLDVGFSITTTGGATYKENNAQRYYVKEPKELYGDADGVPVYVDKSLTISGRAADAAETGKQFLATNEKIGDVRTDMSELQRSTASSFKELETDIGKVDARVSNLATLKEGSTTGDAELIDIRMDFNQINWGTAGAAVRGQALRAVNAIRYNEEQHILAEKIDRLSNGHMQLINIDRTRNITAYKDVSGVATKDTSVYPRGTDIIKAPRLLAFDLDTDAEVYIYFYDLVNNEYKLNRDILNVVKNGKINLVKKADLDTFKRLITIPEGKYMQIGMTDTEANSGRTHNFFAWDGEPFGIKLTADPIKLNNDGTPSALRADGTCSITIPGDAEYVILKGKLDNSDGFYSASNLIGFKNGVRSRVSGQDDYQRLYKLPRGYDFFRLQLWPSNKNALTGDVSEYVSVIVEHSAEKPSGFAKKILKNCEQLAEKIRWTPKAEVYVLGEKGASFKSGVTYNGLPYCSNWKLAHYIGWHVSPHTFLNAVNDEDSIFYNERVADDDGDTAPYYGTVCTAYAQMCHGWPYPLVGNAYDPNVITGYIAEPQIGMINIFTGHAMIPVEIYHFPNDMAVAAYESIRPFSMRTTRYEKVPYNTDTLGAYVPSSWGRGYYEGVRWTEHHKSATGNLSSVPYLGLTDDDLKITGGTARPYKGDKCVYTSEEAVKINIKDTTATILYLQKDGGTAKSISISAGTAQVDVKSQLDGDGIYFVWTDAGDVKESFEYHEVEPIKYTIENVHTNANGKKGGTPKFEGEGLPNFWYAEFSMNGHPSVVGNKTVSQFPKTDYSYLIKDEIVCRGVYAIFRKGTYGAYNVPADGPYYI